MHAPDSLEQHNLICQSKELLVYMFCFQLVFLYLDEVDQCVDQLFQQLLHLILKSIVEHHVLLDVEVQSLNLKF